jgi:GGDEF domain-containing protein
MSGKDAFTVPTSGATEAPPTELPPTPAASPPTPQAEAPAAPPAAPKLWDDLAEQQAASAPAPNLWDDLAAANEERTKAEDETLSSYFKLSLAAPQDDPERRRRVKELARQTGISADIVDARFDAFSVAAEWARHDQALFRKDFPGLTEWLLKRPEEAATAVKEQGWLRTLATNFDNVWQWKAAHDEAADDLRALPFFPSDEEVAAFKRKHAAEPLPDFPSWEGPKSVLVQLDKSAEGTTGLTHTWKVAAAAFEHNKKQVEHSKLYVSILLKRRRGESTWEEEKRAVDLEGQLQARDYGQEGLLESGLVDTATILPQQIEMLKEAGLWGTAGAAAGAGVGVAVGVGTRSAEAGRTAAKSFAKLGWRIGASAGLAKESFLTETGSAYAEFLKETTDDGQHMSEPLAAGAAVLYGAVSTGLTLEAMPKLLGVFGAIGDAAAGKARRQAIVAATKSGRFRALLTDLGGRLLTGAKGEFKEESLQSISQSLISYAAESVTDAKLQVGAPAGALVSAAEEGTAAAIGAGFLGAPHAAVSLVARGVGIAASKEGARRGQLLTEAAAEGSPLASGAPTTVAKVAELHAAQTGSDASTMYVDPRAVLTLNQTVNGKLEETADALFGEGGHQKLQDALQTGGKVAVPTADFLANLAGKQNFATGLAEHVTTEAGGYSTAEEKAHEEHTAAEAKRMREAAEAGTLEAESPTESRIADGLLLQLLQAGHKEADAKVEVQLWQAMLRTTAERMRLPSEEIFRKWEVTAQREGTAMGPTATRGAVYAQGGTTHAVPHLETAFRELSDDAQQRLYYEDPTTGLLNDAAMRDLPPDPARPNFGLLTFAFKKPINDALGHEELNNLYRDIGRALRAEEPHAAKVRGDFWVPGVASEKDLKDLVDRVRARLQPVLPAGLKELPLAAALVPRVEAEKIEATSHRASDKLGEVVEGMRGAGTYPDRDAPPPSLEGLAFGGEAPAAQALPSPLVEKFKGLTEFDKAMDSYVERDTGILKKAGWKEVRKRSPKPFVAAVDVRAVGHMDKKLGHVKTDKLVRVISRAFAAAGGHRFDVAHMSGDEYMLQSDDKKALEEFLGALRQALSEFRLRVVAPSGQVYLQEGLHFAFGIAEGHNAEHEADAVALPAAKRADPRDKSWFEGRTRLLTDAERRVRPAAGDIPGAGALRQRGGHQPGGIQRQVLSGLIGAPGQRSAQDVATYSDTGGASGKEPIGWVRFVREGAIRLAQIVLTEKANKSTFLHESGHVFLEMLGDLSSREDAPALVREDYNLLLEFLGVSKREDIAEEHHEKFARAFEAYLREGKAPSAGLRRAFRRFRLWLVDVYRTLARLNVELTPDIRGVFDRLLATDREIAAERGRAGMDTPVFRTPEEAGMSAEEWTAYQAAREKSATLAQESATRRVLEDDARETEAWWHEELAQHEEQAGKEYDERPDVRARLFLTTGAVEAGTETPTPQPLSAQGVKDVLGVDEVPQALKELVTDNEDAPHPDDVGAAFGYPDGKAFLAALQNVPEKAAFVQETAEAAMREAHPEILAEREKLSDMLQGALHNAPSGEALLLELAALRRKAGATNEAPLAAIKRAAKEMVARTQVGQLYAGRALQAERSKAEAAFRFAAKGQWLQAFAAKQQQVLNHFIYREVVEARKTPERFERLVKQAKKSTAQARLGKAHPALRDGVDALLEAVGAKEVPQRSAPLAPLSEAAQVVTDAGGTAGIDLPALSALIAQPRFWKSLTVAELQTVVDAINNMKATARGLTTLLVEDKRVDDEEVLSALEQEAADNLPELPDAPSSGAAATVQQKVTGWFAAQDGSLLKPETMLRWLGGRKLDSMWHKAVVSVMQRAKQREMELMKQVAAPIVAAFDAMPKEVKRRLSEKVDGQALFPTHRRDVKVAPPSRRFELLAVALNFGTQSNRDRLTKGRGITEAQVQAAINLLTKEEMDWVQTVWDAMDSLWPLASELEERDSGLRPLKLEAASIVTPHGTYRGGYYPAVYDPRVEKVGEKQAAQGLAALFDAAFARPGTSHGHLKGRVQDFSGFIVLDLSAIQSHLGKVTHDIAFREAVKSVGRIILNPRIRTVLNARLGFERAEQLKLWLTDVGGGSAAGLDAHTKAMSSFYRWMSANMTKSVLGYAIPTALGDAANYAVAATVLKKRHWADGLTSYYKDIPGATKLVHSLSAEMRFRDEGLVSELRRDMEKMTKSGPLAHGPLAAYRDSAFVFMEVTDKATSIPTWLGAFKQAAEEGKSEAQAVEFADSVVRQLFPSQSVVDKAGWLRDKGFMGMITSMYGYLSVVYNQQRDIAHELHTAKGTRELLKRTPLVVGRLLALWATSIVLGELLTGRGPDDDDGQDELERWRNYLARKMALAPFVPLPIPVASLMESWALGKKPSMRAAPGFAFIDPMLRAAGRAYKAAKSGEDVNTTKLAEESIKATGFLLGLPTRPLPQVEYLLRLGGLGTTLGLEGGDAELDVLGTPSGLIYGERPHQPRNVFTTVKKAME